jgi:hypothetical protein
MLAEPAYELGVGEVGLAVVIRLGVEALNSGSGVSIVVGLVVDGLGFVFGTVLVDEGARDEVQDRKSVV